ncbi:MAG: hypothetical protein JOZ17_26180, partial [Acetobacteraceae bacterium]|nr:hypothetical protein [Acetobacteraceae bacterium]
QSELAELRQRVTALGHSKADKSDVARLAADIAQLRAEIYTRFERADARFEQLEAEIRGIHPQIAHVQETMSTNPAILLNAIKDQG